jgi:hypothetical protein
VRACACHGSIYFEAASEICHALCQHEGSSSLKVVSFAFNWIGVLGSRALGESCVRGSSLRGSSPLAEPAVRCAGIALGSGNLRELTVLDLRGNGITSGGLTLSMKI